MNARVVIYGAAALVAGVVVWKVAQAIADALRTGQDVASAAADAAKAAVKSVADVAANVVSSAGNAIGNAAGDAWEATHPAQVAAERGSYSPRTWTAPPGYYWARLAGGTMTLIPNDTPPPKGATTEASAAKLAAYYGDVSSADVAALTGN